MHREAAKRAKNTNNMNDLCVLGVSAVQNLHGAGAKNKIHIKNLLKNLRVLRSFAVNL
jgi:hypothetical protein